MEKQEIKEELIESCREFIYQRLMVSEKALSNINDSKHSETKSSVGDKYETGRAMLHFEEDKHHKQLAEAKKVKMILDILDPEKVYERIAFGTVVYTDNGNYFISISAGRLIVDNVKYFAISSKTPLAQSLVGKTANDQVTFNEKPIKILSFF